MIGSFKDKRTEAVFHGRAPKGFPASLLTVGRRKLQMPQAATVLDDLRAPPANRLESLKGDRKGQHSIRIDDPFRACFHWNGKGAEGVDITDHH